MDFHSSTLDKLFDLFPIIIPGAVEQVKPVGLADVGVSRNLANSDSRGLEVIIDPPAEMKLLGSSAESSIRVDIYIVDNPNAVTGKNITEEEENKRMTLHVPPSFLSHGVNRLYYILTRASGNKQPSRELSVLYHLRASTGLVLTIPSDIREKGVDAAQAAKGVLFTFTYNNRRPFDRIEFLLGDTIVRFNVPDGSAPITCTLFTEDFEKAGDNPEAIAEFFVIDQLGNHAQSPQQTLGIHLAEVELSPPTLVKPAVDPIDVLNHKDGATIRIDYPGA